jgi:hypothetical protein
MTYKEVFQLAQEKGCPLLRCKHCQSIELNSLKDNYCTSCFPYEQTPTTKWAVSDINLMILTLIQKWLRDEHKINVQPSYIFHREDEGLPPYNVGKIPNSYTSFIATGEKLYFNTYEEALLQGINEALKLI